ncbi:MAG: BatD family protein [Candidatus Onthomorpha sp.]|nr:BatD family protein [Candidatus Onthomorpha sp.]
MNKKVFLFFASLFATFALLSQEITFRCEAPKVVGLNERFKVSFTINASNPQNFVAPTFQNVNILGGPSTSRSSSVSIINGKRTDNSSTSFVFFLQSLTTGKIIIPSARVKVDGKLYTTKPVTITVEDNPSMAQRSQNSRSNNRNTQSTQPSVKVIDDKAVFVRAIPSKTKVVKGEEIVISYKIYTLVPISEYSVDKFPTSQGFWVEELDNQATPTLEKEVIDGKVYQVATLRKVLVYPQKAGTLHINPMGLEVVAHIQTGTSRRERVSTGDPFFDAFFNDPFFAHSTPVFERVNKKLKTNALTIEVEELPQTTENFDGAVGQFTLSSSADTSFSRTNEAITLSYTISGKGNLSLIDRLQLNLPDEFEVYEPNISDKLTKNASGQSGSRTFQYIIIPRVEGNYTIPPLKFTYFDPDTKTYKTIETQEYKLNIAKGRSDNKFAEQMSEREKYRNMDINDNICKATGKDISLAKPFSSGVLYALVVLILCGLVVMIKLTRKELKLREDTVGLKLKKADKVAMKRLKKAKKYLDSDLKEEFETEIGQALWNYLSDKFKIETRNLSIETIKTTLNQSNLSDETLQQTIKTLNDCEFLRFSQSSDKSNHRELYEQTVKTISDIETEMSKMKKQNKHSSKGTICLLLLVASGSLFAQDLTKANAAYKAKDYQTAIELYLQAEKTAPSADLYHSIADTYFRLSDYANGILYYERALRLTPNDKTLITDYKICRSRLMGEVYIMPDFFLLRWIKAISNLMPPFAWAIVFVVLFFAACVLFFIYYFTSDKKRMMFYLSLCSLILSLCSFGLGFERQNRIHSKDYAVVFSSDTALREETSGKQESKTKLFKGQKVKIKKQAGKEVFVRTEDGKEGWIDKENIKII